MKSYWHTYFEELKAIVLHKSNIQHVTAADCYQISLDIKLATKRSISETTLKRVYKFATSAHAPSSYTLDALAQYSGFASWDDFYKRMEEKQLTNSENKTWDEVKANATKISQFNLQSNKYKSGINYQHTVDRKYIDDFITEFKASPATVAILDTPAGYGKTIGISRWVEAQLNHSREANGNNIHLFINALSLVQGTAFGYLGNRWLMNLLDFSSTQLLDQFMDVHAVEAPGDFYLIIDQLHNNFVSERQFYTVISHFLEMINHFSQFKWFRIILLLRTDTLLKYNTLFPHESFNPNWYIPSVGSDAKGLGRMTTFTKHELNKLLHNINSQLSSDRIFTATRFPFLRIPIYFQYFYELKDGKIDPYGICAYDEFNIASYCLNKHVHNGPEQTAKQLFLENLAPYIHEIEGSYSICQKEVFHLLNDFKTIYQDLQSVGLLNKKTNILFGKRTTVISFESDLIAAYLVASDYEIKTRGDKQKFFELVNKEHTDDVFKKQIAQWILIFYVERGDLSILDELKTAPFIDYYSQEFMSFIIACLHDKHNRAPERLKEKIKSEIQNRYLIETVVRLDCFDTDIDVYYNKLLALSLPDKHNILLHFKLGLVALLKWEEDTFLSRMELMADIPAEAYADLLINPQHSLLTLYHYFKYGELDKQAIDEWLIPVIESSSVAALKVRYPIFDIIVFMVAKMIKDPNIFRKYYDNVIAASPTPPNYLKHDPYSDFNRLIAASFLLACDEVGAAKKLFADTAESTPRSLTAKLLYLNLDIYFKKEGNENDNEAGQQAINICDAFQFKLLKTYFTLTILYSIPKNTRKHHIENLKYHFDAFGYTLK